MACFRRQDRLADTGSSSQTITKTEIGPMHLVNTSSVYSNGFRVVKVPGHLKQHLLCYQILFWDCAPATLNLKGQY